MFAVVWFGTTAVVRNFLPLLAKILIVYIEPVEPSSLGQRFRTTKPFASVVPLIKSGTT
jgi:hypothetical protein